MSRKDVFEFLIDGTSGIAPGDVSGSVLVVGACSLGEVGQGYLLGRDSDLEGELGVGPLVDRLNDLFSAAGQSAVVIAVPVAGIPGGYISGIEHTGEGPDAATSGVPGGNADAVLEIVAGGELGTATYKLSLDGGDTYGETSNTPANGQVAIGTTGVTLVLGTTGDQIAGDVYQFAVRGSIGPVSLVGTGPEIAASGTVLAAAQVQLEIVRAGGRNTGQYQLSVDGGDTFGSYRTIPLDGEIPVGSTGATITFPDSDAVLGDVYSFDLQPPAPTISSVVDALETPLELYDPEFVYLVGPSDSVDWAALGVLADDLWNAHRPTWFLTEFRLPREGETLTEWAEVWLAEEAGYAHRFVASCVAFGEIADRTGQTKLRNAAGLLAGRVLSIPVQRDIGRVKDGPISQLTVDDGWNGSLQVTLEEAGAITPTRYANLDGVYWGTGMTLAEATSDFRRIEVIRTTFKAIRLMRIAALGSLKDEVGDLVLGDNASGIAFLKAKLENALNTMTAAIPPELAAYVIDIPSGQDVANNGLAASPTLIGIPIIDKIKLFTRYVYAGGKFDPRLETTA